MYFIVIKMWLPVCFQLFSMQMGEVEVDPDQGQVQGQGAHLLQAGW